MLADGDAMTHRYVVRGNNLDVVTRREVRLEELLRCCLVALYDQKKQLTNCGIRWHLVRALIEEVEKTLLPPGEGEKHHDPR